ncbi:MAG TPA: AtpZ/AtpI family protein [Caulobacteraceae bacterium]|nr:AtpZ/AtpI family protein [Caulobacteraceae bacterium]
MSEPHDPDDRALKRLGAKLDAFEDARKPQASLLGGSGDVQGGYRFLAGLIGGLLGGLGLGWTFDHFAHTSPLGLIGGLLVGLGVSIYVAVRTALRMSAAADAVRGPAPPAPAGDDDEDA